MRLGWKVLVPANLVWIVVVASVRTIQRSGGLSTPQILIGGGVIVVVVVLLSLLLPEKQIPGDDYVPITGGGFPLPPLDLRVPETTPRRKALARAQAKAARRKPAAVGTAKEGAHDGDV
jgi:NADH-quinone oxidoreductase subunit H